MLLHKLPKKTVRRLRKSVIWTDIAVNPAMVAAHGLMKDLARRGRSLSPRGNWLRSITALTRNISRYTSHATRQRNLPGGRE
jgi:hypothetical protein